MSENRRWINFGKYSSPPIGRGKILDCFITDKYNPLDLPMLYLKLEVNGVVYEGALPVKVSEDEEE